MILINLLPHREAARKLRREMFYAALGASAVAGVVVAGGVWLWYGAQIDTQMARNQVLSTEIASLRARQLAVEDLPADRNMPVHLLNEMVRLLPDGVYLTSLKQTGETVALGGVAQSNERVSELLRNLASGSTWITKPELIEIVAGNVTLPPKDTRRVANFRMTIKLVRASEVQKAAAAAASAASAAGTSVVPTAAPANRAPAAAAPAAGTVAAAPAPAKK